MTHAPVVVTQGEMAKEREAALAVKGHPSRPQTYHIVTFGCQMNAHDSEKLAGMLEEMGMAKAQEREDADFVLFNTCCVRENAENKALGNILWLNDLKKRKPGLLIGVCGCMIQQPHMAKKVLEQYRFIDLAFGTHNLYDLPQMLLRLLEDKRRVVNIEAQESLLAEGVPVHRLTPYQAYITIMYGCDNFCSYCVVPYVRGRERSRSPEAVLEEAKALYDSGVEEITLLGQNVNSYGKGLSDGVSFPSLLAQLDKIGIPRIRFMTSHPKDLTQELIDVMAGSEHICHHLHLPVQSGNDEILSRMNRRYTREAYLGKVEHLRKAMPDIGLTTDLIVGFPGETEAQFLDTVSLVDQVGYDAAFTFIYSPREGTVAAKMPGQIESSESTRRIEALIKAVEASAQRQHEKLIGTSERVLVTGLSRRESDRVSGKGERNITISFTGTQADIGQIVPVTITSSAVNTLRAERI